MIWVIEQHLAGTGKWFAVRGMVFRTKARAQIALRALPPGRYKIECYNV